MNELGNTPADKNYQPSGIVNDITDDSTKAVKLTDGIFVTQSLYYQHRMQALKTFLSWQDVKRIVEIADQLCPFGSVKLADFDHELQTEEGYYREVLERFNTEKPEHDLETADNHAPFTSRYSAERRYRILLSLSENAWGRKLTESRTYDDTRIRMFVSYMMWKEGYSYGKIGKAMGRNHSSVINHVKRMNNVFDEPVFYAEEVSKYELFNEMVKEYDGE